MFGVGVVALGFNVYLMFLCSGLGSIGCSMYICGFLCFGLGQHLFFNVVFGGLWPGKTLVDHVLFLCWARALENIGCSMLVLVFLASGLGKHYCSMSLLVVLGSGLEKHWFINVFCGIASTRGP